MKTVEEKRAYAALWYQNRKNGIPTNTRFRASEEHKRERINRTAKKTRAKKYKMWKDKVNSLLGTKCIICGSTSHLICHKKDGEKHHGYCGTLFVDAITNPNEFVRVCYGCHKGIHWSMQWFNMSWEQIISNIESNRSLEGY